MELMPHLKLPDNLGVRYAILKGLPKKLTALYDVNEGIESLD